MTDHKETIDLYQIITDQIIALLEQGTVPWRQSWAEAGLPQNLFTRKPYRGINLMLLAALQYEQNYFLTLKQINAVGGKVRKGEKSTMIVFWNGKEVTNEKGEKETRYFLRYYRVFNISQCEDIPKGLMPVPVYANNDLIFECEHILSGMPHPPKIIQKEKDPFYNRVEDFINMPKLKTFVDSESYYAVLFHELVHSTGHTSRLNRKELMESESFGTELYSMEELTAEMGACYLRSHAGILREKLSNSAAYINGWLAQLHNDKKFIFHAASQAQKAVDYILNVQMEEHLQTAEAVNADLPY
jgi:antirestriction protein ArdC